MRKYNGIIPIPVLRKGKKGTNVRNLQIFLKWYGSNLIVDGIFGSKTALALRGFQKSEGLVPDSIYGKKTEAKVRKYKEASFKPIPKPSIPDDLPKKCIDVSYWQGKISQSNWQKIKKTCGSAICRA